MPFTGMCRHHQREGLIARVQETMIYGNMSLASLGLLKVMFMFSVFTKTSHETLQV